MLFLLDIARNYEILKIKDVVSCNICIWGLSVSSAHPTPTRSRGVKLAHGGSLTSSHFYWVDMDYYFAYCLRTTIYMANIRKNKIFGKRECYKSPKKLRWKHCRGDQLYSPLVSEGKLHGAYFDYNLCPSILACLPCYSPLFEIINWLVREGTPTPWSTEYTP